MVIKYMNFNPAYHNMVDEAIMFGCSKLPEQHLRAAKDYADGYTVPESIGLGGFTSVVRTSDPITYSPKTLTGELWYQKMYDLGHYQYADKLKAYWNNKRNYCSQND